MCFLAGSVGNNSVDADDGENKAENSQYSRQHRSNLVKQQSVESVKSLVHCLYVEQWQLRGQRLNHAFNFRDHCFSGAGGANLKDLERVSHLVLGEGDVEYGVDLARHALEASISCYAHHYDGMFVFRGHLELVADWIHVGPKLLGHFVANDGHVLGVLVVGTGEASPAKHGNSQGLKIITRDRDVQRGRSGLTRRRLISLDRQIIAVVVVAERCGAGLGNCYNSRNAAHAREKILVEVARLRLVVTDFRSE